MSSNFIQVPGAYALAYAPSLFDPNHDPYWNQVATLLHFDGAQGNSTFTDVKGRPITNSGVITDLGSPAIAPASGYWGGSQAMNVSEVDDNQTGDFTIEFFIKWETINNSTLFDTRPMSTNGSYIDFYYSAGSIGIWMNNTSVAGAGFNPTVGKTYHFALSHKAGVTRMFVDGVLYFTRNYTGVYAIPRFFLGGNGYNQAQDFFKGRMSEFRYTKGVGRYENPFTPVYARFPASL